MCLVDGLAEAVGACVDCGGCAVGSGVVDLCLGRRSKWQAKPPGSCGLSPSW